MPNRISQLRKEYHMTQVRLSVELEVSQETVSAYEKEKHYPSFAQLVKLSSLFHASIDYIMGLSDIRNPVGKAENNLTMRLLGQCHRLTPKQQELVLAYIQGLVDMGSNR